MLKIELEQPSPRAGHSITKINNQWYMFGGASHEEGFKSDLYLLDGTWKQLSSSTIPRYEHTAIPLKQNLLVLFGSGESGPLVSPQLFDTETQTWSDLEIKGSITPRILRSAGVVGDRVYVFGGGQYNDEPIEDTGDMVYVYGGMCKEKTLDDLWQFNTKTNRWTQLEAFEERCAHTCVNYNDKLYVYGGMKTQPLMIHDTLVSYDGEWKVQGKYNGRIDHACVVDNGIVVHGGMSFSNVFQDGFKLLMTGNKVEDHFKVVDTNAEVDESTQLYIEMLN
ncbi:hypothetical protein HDV01_007530 [Terramyces sp. JEL0728]|nr:hypothetical protein HDV01_007530 [Terramyces sp. JEL0728]